MRTKRFFAAVWRINAVAILLTTILACGLLAFAAFQIYKDARRPQQVTDVVNIADAQVDRSTAQLGSFERIAGSRILRAPLRLEQQYGFSSGSKEASSIQNYLFYDPSDGRAYWLVPGYQGLFLTTRELPEHDYNTKPEVPVAIVVYELIDSDSTGDKKLTGSDARTIAVSTPSGSRLTRVLTGVDRLNGTSLVTDDRLLVFYTSSSTVRVAEVDVATHKVVRNSALQAGTVGGR